MIEVVHPRLRRAVWLTAAQRDALREATEWATNKNPRKDLADILDELARVERRAARLTDLVRATVQGLKLPPDALPVYLSDAQADALMAITSLEIEVVVLIRPQPRIHHDPDE